MSLRNEDDPANSSYVSLSCTNKGLSSFSRKEIKQGEVVGNLTDLPIKDENDKYAITRDKGEFWDTVGTWFSRLNHSCEPNLIFDCKSWLLTAARDIHVNEELTFNYLQTEYEMASPFQCSCGSKSCYGFISGFKNLSEENKKRVLSELNVSPLILNEENNLKTT